MWIVWLIFLFQILYILLAREKKHMKQVTIDKILNGKHTF